MNHQGGSVPARPRPGRKASPACFLCTPCSLGKIANREDDNTPRRVSLGKIAKREDDNTPRRPRSANRGGVHPGPPGRDRGRRGRPRFEVTLLPLWQHATTRERKEGGRGLDIGKGGSAGGQ